MKLSMNLGTDMEYFLTLSLFELRETIDDYLEVRKEIVGEK